MFKILLNAKNILDYHIHNSHRTLYWSIGCLEESSFVRQESSKTYILN